MGKIRRFDHDLDTGALVRLLGQHFGDRSIYLRDRRDRLLLRDAMHHGLVSSSGRLTSRGYAFWQRHEEDGVNAGP